jgi:predicted kinase
MRTIFVLRGIPASGKSTFCKQFLIDNPKYYRVNRDSIRRGLIGETYDQRIENLVTQIETYTLESILGKGKNVIVDNCHCTESYFSEICNIAKRIGEIQVTEKIFDVSFEECCRRNNNRTGIEKVPDNVMKKMQENFSHISKTERTIYFPKKHNAFITNLDLPNACMVDIDGTLALHGDRGPFDWNKISTDYLNVPIANIVKTYHNTGTKIIIMSGRGIENQIKVDTEAWLKKYEIPYDYIFMRNAGDNRADDIVKRELYEANVLNKFNVLFVLDDRSKVCRMWRNMNLTVLQVAEGNF